MKTRPLSAAALLLTLLFAGPAPCRADTAAPSPKPVGDLTIVVVETLTRGEPRIANFDRISSVFTEVFERRKWPLSIRVERFASNTTNDETQLRIFYQGTYEEAPGELAFHAWMILYEHGNKHDFGVVKYRESVKPYQQEDLVLEHLFRGAAAIAADKVDAVLFPKAQAKKP